MELETGAPGVDYSAPGVTIICMTKSVSGAKVTVWQVVPLLAAGVAIATIPFVAGADPEPSVHTASETTTSVVTQTPTQELLSPRRAPELEDVTVDTETDQISYYNLSTGTHLGTASERFARPALSLSKLYIADYVLEHGNAQQRQQALAMLKDSNDATADSLFKAFPKSINATAKKYNLESTYSEGKWGYSYTSMYDVMTFVATLLAQNPDSPILQAMRDAKPTAADGTKQNFGTAVVAGVEGSKWGWSDDLSLHSSVSFGEDFVIAAATLGSAKDLTTLVREEVIPVVK